MTYNIKHRTQSDCNIKNVNYGFISTVTDKDLISSVLFSECFPGKTLVVGACSVSSWREQYNRWCSGCEESARIFTFRLSDLQEAHISQPCRTDQPQWFVLQFCFNVAGFFCCEWSQTRQRWRRREPTNPFRSFLKFHSNHVMIYCVVQCCYAGTLCRF